MKRQMHSNSLEVHNDNLEIGKYKKQIQNIYEALKFIESGTMHNVASFLGVPLNTISGRFKEMRELGLIEQTGKRINRSSVYTLKNEKKK